MGYAVKPRLPNEHPDSSPIDAIHKYNDLMIVWFNH